MGLRIAHPIDIAEGPEGSRQEDGAERGRQGPHADAARIVRIGVLDVVVVELKSIETKAGSDVVKENLASSRCVRGVPVHGSAGAQILADQPDSGPETELAADSVIACGEAQAWSDV